MEKQDILDYVSKTPENVNVNVLDGMLDELASGGGGGGSAEPFFFVAEMKGIDPESNEPIIEETSITYNDLISKINSGCPIYGHMIVPLEYSSMDMGMVDEISPLIDVIHYYDPDSNTHDYEVHLGLHTTFRAHSPTEVLTMHESGGNGNPGNPT